MINWYDVSYFDSVHGGAGLERVEAKTLHLWLREHPGYLIRRLDPHWGEVSL